MRVLTFFDDDGWGRGDRHTLLLDGLRGGHWPVEGVGDVAVLMPLPLTIDPHSSSEAHSQALCRDGSSAGVEAELGGEGVVVLIQYVAGKKVRQEVKLGWCRV